MNVPETVEAEDYFWYYCEDEKAKEFWAEVKEKLAEAELVETSKDMEIELLQEQLYFARELVSELEHELHAETRLTGFKKTFRRLVSDSYFEL